MRKRNHSKRVLVGAAALTMLFAGSAFTAENTGIEQHAAGTGSATISGVEVTSISYVLNNDRTDVVEVNFEHSNDDVENAEAEVRLQDDGTWYTDCEVENATYDGEDLTAEGTITCLTTDPQAQDFEAANQLTLVVGDNLSSEEA